MRRFILICFQVPKALNVTTKECALHTPALCIPASLGAHHLPTGD